MIVVSDTSPLRYLILVDHAHLIEEIFGHVLVPSAVEQELTDPSTPQEVRRWMSQRPSWIEVRSTRNPDLELLRQLDRGEAEAVQLAIDLKADMPLIDEFRGRNVAASCGVTVIGVLGILLESYRRLRIENPLEVLARLRAIRFRLSLRLLHEFEEQVGLIGRSHEG